jgi:glycosyltransferase involved in cell wall biosynthesis
LAADRNFPYEFLSLNDPQGLHSVHVGSTEFSLYGHARSKSQFVLAAMRAASRKPSLVIAMHPHLAPIVWAMRIRSPKCFSMVFAHGIEVWQSLGWPRGPALRLANMVIGPSTDTVRHLISEQGIDPQKTRRLAWGLDPEFEARFLKPCPPQLPPGFPEGARIILTVGRWDARERYKGADTLITVLPRVLQTAPDVFLVLVGDGDDRPRLEQLARDLGVSERTRFLHGLTPDELFACYAKCEVFALPSRGEGFGFVFLEAMAHAKPVIGGAHGGVPDVIEDGASGVLVQHGDLDRLSVALESVLSNPSRAREMGARGRQRLLSEYSFEQFQSRLTAILDDVLNRKH